MAHQLEGIRTALNQVRMNLMNKPNVVATGIGYKVTNGKLTDQLAIIVSVSTKVAAKALSAEEIIPSAIDGVPTDVYPSGIFTAQQDPKDRFRPAPGGVSIGHINITAGTLGCLVQKNGKKYILSNNHVLANSNDASIGDPILQPGPYDGGGMPQDHIADLSEFIPIKFKEDDGGGSSPCPFANAAAGVLNAFAAAVGSKTRLRAVYKASSQAATNTVDCALARPLNEADVLNEILNIGKINGVAEGLLGMSVQKSGRTTGHTTGTIQQVDVTVDVSYGTGKTATFVDQLMTGNMSSGGDSGSAVLDNDKNIVGLLFAGSSSNTILNRIQNVFDALNVTIIEE
ncbi:MAG TPA: hypothetical protein ENK44_08970 [Caldithrix abyssi]|uniref:Nal1 N-terminal domain-containing protein n=1 Tax=Caldithrix abyssi TaxID=187145 RepID=A0A7V4WV39_CALAY|nr:hypothetical protein [Caldithrix abyssi]